MFRARFHSGQVGLILMIVLGLLIVLIMSLASRSLSDTVSSRQEKEQSSAFVTAESGIEEALRLIRSGQVPSGVPNISDSTGLFTGSYRVDPQSTLEIFVREGEVAHIDLTGFVMPSLQVLWTKSGVSSENPNCASQGSGNAPAALEVAVSGANNVLSRAYYNSSGCSLPANGFASASAGSGGFVSSVNVSIPVSSSYLRLRPIYSGATIRVVGSGLALQQYVIQSEASGGDSQKEIEVRRTLDYPASVFDFALFSGTTLVK
jgi:Tfp pilus assembly protein PilX